MSLALDGGYGTEGEAFVFPWSCTWSRGGGGPAAEERKERGPSTSTAGSQLSKRAKG